MIGIFPLRGEFSLVEPGIPDGIYENLITGQRTEVWGGRIAVSGEPVILKI